MNIYKGHNLKPENCLTLVLLSNCSILNNISLDRIEVKIHVYFEALSGMPIINICYT